MKRKTVPGMTKKLPTKPELSPGGYVTKDSGERQEFSTGAVRDTQEGKPRYSLIPPAPLKRLAELYTRGAEKYDAYNWHKGQPTSRIFDSLLRHIEAYRLGDRSEDHLAAVSWNAFAMMEFEGTELDDLYNWNQRNSEPEGIVGSLYGITVAHISNVGDPREHIEPLEECWCHDCK